MRRAGSRPISRKEPEHDNSTGDKVTRIYDSANLSCRDGRADYENRVLR
jgi:hypothetical protein